MIRSTRIWLALLALVAIVLAAPAAHAVSLGLPAAAAEDPDANNCARNTTTGTGHKYVTADCSGAADQCTLWHFQLPGDYQANSTITPYVNFQNKATGTGASTWRWDIACVDNAEAYNAPTFTSGQTFTYTPGGTSLALGQVGPGGVTVVDETACSPYDSVVMKLCRVGSTDANNDTIGVVDVTLEYTP